MRKLTLTILMLVSMLSTTAQASDKKDIGFTDGAIIFATGYALQVGALTSVHFNEDLAPLAYIGFMGAGAPRISLAMASATMGIWDGRSLVLWSVALAQQPLGGSSASP